MSPQPQPVLVVDHHDSFTYNVVSALETRGAACHVVAHDATSVEQLLEAYAVVLSPGPCSPKQAPISLQFAREALQSSAPPHILGVCLGPQILAEASGAVIARSSRPLHGKLESIEHDAKGLFESLPIPLGVARYNSLCIQPGSLPDAFEVSARNASGEAMALRHRTLPIRSVQFHPESHLCLNVAVLFERWLQLSGVKSV